jgi:hypothetical protein
MSYELFTERAKGLPLQDRVNLWHDMFTAVKVPPTAPKQTLQEQYRSLERPVPFEGMRHTEEVKKKIAESMKGNQHAKK